MWLNIGGSFEVMEWQYAHSVGGCILRLWRLQVVAKVVRCWLEVVISGYSVLIGEWSEASKWTAVHVSHLQCALRYVQASRSPYNQFDILESVRVEGKWVEGHTHGCSSRPIVWHVVRSLKCCFLFPSTIPLFGCLAWTGVSKCNVYQESVFCCWGVAERAAVLVGALN